MMDPQCLDAIEAITARQRLDRAAVNCVRAHVLTHDGALRLATVVDGVGPREAKQAFRLLASFGVTVEPAELRESWLRAYARVDPLRAGDAHNPDPHPTDHLLSAAFRSAAALTGAERWLDWMTAGTESFRRVRRRVTRDEAGREVHHLEDPDEWYAVRDRLGLLYALGKPLEEFANLDHVIRRWLAVDADHAAAAPVHGEPYKIQPGDELHAVPQHRNPLTLLPTAHEVDHVAHADGKDAAYTLAVGGRVYLIPNVPRGGAVVGVPPFRHSDVGVQLAKLPKHTKIVVSLTSTAPRSADRVLTTLLDRGWTLRGVAWHNQDGPGRNGYLVFDTGENAGRGLPRPNEREPNPRPGPCTSCGTSVPAGRGFQWGEASGVQHEPGQCVSGLFCNGRRAKAIAVTLPGESQEERDVWTAAVHLRDRGQGDAWFLTRKKSGSTDWRMPSGDTATVDRQSMRTRAAQLALTVAKPQEEHVDG